MTAKVAAYYNRPKNTINEVIPTTGHSYGDWIVVLEPTSTAEGTVDAQAESYCYEPILWAAWKGITSGTDAIHFPPEQPCTGIHTD